MAKIVYLLGAGASAQAIPPVSEMLIRMRYFLFCLEQKVNKAENMSEKVFNRLTAYNSLLIEASKHLSIDTLAKKLYLLEEFETLLYLREFISLYFIFEHFYHSEYESYIYGYLEFYEASTEEESNVSNVLYKYSRRQLDPRYDAFIASISKKNLTRSLFLPPNISIISWNYDLQFEKAMSVYDKFDSRGIDYLFNPIDYSRQDVNFEFSNEYIKLNGSTGHKLLEEEELENKDMMDSTCRTNISPYHLNIKGHSIDFELMIKYLIDYTEAVNINRYRPYINFAWEENKLSKSNIGRACQKMEDADSIVVIGYSFPTFNREVDCQLFSNLDLGRGCKIYVQTPSEKEFIGIRTRILGISAGINEKDIEFIDDISQFYIPFEFSKEVDKRVILTMLPS